jgi:chromosome segregation ATPase
MATDDAFGASEQEPHMQSYRDIRATVAYLLLLSGAALLAPRPAVAQLLSTDPAAVKETKRLVKEAETLIKDVEVLQEQIRTTLAAHGALFSGRYEDLRKPYRQLDKEIDKCEKRRVAVRDQVDRTKSRADDYFRGWTANLPAISSEDLRTRSAARANDARERFEGILETGRRAAAEYQPFLAQLRDQWTYLGHDLNPSGIDSLRADADQLNGQGSQLQLTLDDSLRQARAYVDSMRNTQPPPPPPPPAPEAPPSETPPTP